MSVPKIVTYKLNLVLVEPRLSIDLKSFSNFRLNVGEIRKKTSDSFTFFLVTPVKEH